MDVNLRYYDWHRIGWFPFIERRWVEAIHSTAPTVPYMGWTDYRVTLHPVRNLLAFFHLVPVVIHPDGKRFYRNSADQWMPL